MMRELQLELRNGLSGSVRAAGCLMEMSDPGHDPNLEKQGLQGETQESAFPTHSPSTNES